MSSKSRRRKDNYRTEARAVATIDKLAAFEEFSQDILPALRDAVKAGKGAKDIYAMAAAIAAAKVVSVAVKSTDEKNVLAAAKDILDRDMGKAKESVDITGKLEKLPEQDLDALLLSKLASVGAPASTEEEEGVH